MQKSNSHWDNLGPELIELILSRLPIPSLLRAASASNGIPSSIIPIFFKTLQASSSREHPWFFLTIFSNYTRVFGFDPQSDGWIKFPNTILPPFLSVVSDDGLFFITGLGKNSFDFKSAFGGNWRRIGPLIFPRHNALIGVYDEPDCPKPSSRCIIAGGTRFFPTMERNEPCLAVEVYDPDHNTWETCSPLPEIFSPGDEALCSAIHKGKFHVLDLGWHFISS